MTDDLETLADDLAEFEPEEKQLKRSPVEERVIAGFEDIQRFVEKEGRQPRHGEGRDIFERLYAVRLEQLAQNIEHRALLEPIDSQGLLSNAVFQVDEDEGIDLDILAADLDDLEDATGDITTLKHVRTAEEKRAAEEIATRQKCEDFTKFEPLFKQVQSDIEIGVRETLEFRKGAGFAKTDIKQGQFFIIGGQTGYVANVGKPIKAPNGDTDARLRVIYSNGTENDMLLRSVMRALYKDETSRLISDPAVGPLFAVTSDETDLASGTVYVLRSLSVHPFVSERRDLLHKIGVTGGNVDTRIANAKLDPTFLMADVEIVATYELFNINRSKLEKLIHRIFADARLDMEIPDRFGNKIKPREWFLVPVFAIKEAVVRIQDGTISQYTYSTAEARFIKNNR